MSRVASIYSVYSDDTKHSSVQCHYQGYAPVGALIENGIVPEYFSLGPEPSPPEPRVNHNSQTCNIIYKDILKYQIFLWYFQCDIRNAIYDYYLCLSALTADWMIGTAYSNLI